MSASSHEPSREPAVRPERPTSMWDSLWEPFGEIEPFFRRLARFSELPHMPFGNGWSPVAEHEETEDAYVVRIELPGVPQDKVKVEVEGHELSVSGELDEESRSEGLLSRRVGRFAHRTSLPSTADPEKIEAHMADGVLTVRVPKVPVGGRRSIPISGSGDS